MNEKIPDCRHFTGYKPCAPGRTCDRETCPDRTPSGTRILIVNLDAMGDVLMTTSQLPALKRKYPSSTISWLTLGNAAPLLAGNPYLVTVYTYWFESLSVLGQMAFDIVSRLFPVWSRISTIAHPVSGTLYSMASWGLFADG